MTKFNNSNKNVEVTFKYLPLEGFKPAGISIYNQQGSHYAMDVEDLEFKQEIPAGTYSMHAMFLSKDGDVVLVFLEDRTIDKPMTVSFDQSLAKFPININYVDEKNNSLKLNIFNDKEEVISKGNIEDMTSYSLISYDGAGIVAIIRDNTFKTEKFMDVLRINEVSEKYHFFNGANILKGGVDYFLCCGADLKDASMVKNEASDIFDYTQKFGHTFLGKDQENNYIYGFNFSIVYNGISSVSTIITDKGYIVKESNPSYKVGLPTKYDKYTAMVSAMLGDTADGDGDNKDFHFIKGLPIVGTANDAHFVNFGYEQGFAKGKDGGAEIVYPGHPEFSAKYNSDVILGNNCPIASVLVEEGDIYPTYIGRYGEIFETDNNNYKESIKKDSNKSLVTLTNNNVWVDGMRGSNICNIEFDKKDEDNLPPTLQMLMFKDKSDSVTDHFSTLAGGVLEFAAGDFERKVVDSEGRFYYECKPIDVNVYYSVHDLNEWTSLEYQTDESLFFFPSFGYFYKVDLTAVDCKNQNQWFDIKIVLKDKTGNKQTQILSPAFFSKEKHTASTFQADPNLIQLVRDDNFIVIEGTDNPMVEVYSLDGIRKVSSIGNSIDISELESGIYVVVIKDAFKNRTFKVSF
ncbi:T9SS type A sorting domain-containing protein [Falsiporphyromonas endometrii]|uniref:T9SS type A sorting domain-containing protein n=1 Tax=Falsiporphyromonas endometrii TaxID=1387297 RepID=A0ABV9K5K4_9PORP